MSELDTIRERVTKSVDAILVALHDIEHALADTTTPGSADVVRRAVGGCYSAIERVNSAANSRYWQLDVARVDATFHGFSEHD